MPSPVESRQSSVNSRRASVPFCSLDCPFFCWSCPLFPKSYALLRMVTPFTEGVTPFADGLRSFPRDFQGLRRPTPLPRVGGSFAMHVGSARRGDEYVFFFACIIASSASCSRCVFAWFTALRAGPDLLSSIGGGVGGSHPRTRRFGVVCIA